MARNRAHCTGAGKAEEVTQMALLDIQVLDTEGGHGGHGGGVDSSLSLLLCDSIVSGALC